MSLALYWVSAARFSSQSRSAACGGRQSPLQPRPHGSFSCPSRQDVSHRPAARPQPAAEPGRGQGASAAPFPRLQLRGGPEAAASAGAPHPPDPTNPARRRMDPVPVPSFSWETYG